MSPSITSWPFIGFIFPSASICSWCLIRSFLILCWEQKYRIGSPISKHFQLQNYQINTISSAIILLTKAWFFFFFQELSVPIFWLIICLSALSKWQSLIPKLKTGKTREKDLQKQMTCIETKIKNQCSPFSSARFLVQIKIQWLRTIWKTLLWWCSALSYCLSSRCLPWSTLNEGYEEQQFYKCISIVLVYSYIKKAAQPQLPQQTFLQILTDFLFTPSAGKQLVLLEWGGSILLFFSCPDVVASCYFYPARSTT